ncbi:bifunctional 4-hydroxy-2-oxoglutarate aldolase/2-dehydro-3-deoxy-phosphogluconate aldolase (plasmid) [Embleya sp. NBC_00888]|uniref:bifunctional 4-hydroxy-2-oxoglutarate aldolase/2-dehydro-3-deoxy-phosphogluconate aldolase n=1 Tax=Embleya sp. NBC_00888 TaxID=2975960 RepID=UPI002F918115|nr:bifunctional 4-hydroxy-2-oxoglutarate aldolase/2-dehydro-3-deoxy-phosphogluconate aldolase [Embleya sp. NBC_00888]
MHPAELRSALRSRRLLAIVRGLDPQAALDTVLALFAAGVDIVEVSLTTPDAPAVIERARAALGPDAALGAGTVVTAADALLAARAGAGFAVTPGGTAAVSEARSLGLPVLAGALTPGEVTAVITAGATAVKLFPASLGGPSLLRAMRAPFPDVDFVPVGGIDIAAARDFLAAGALAVGVGSPLVGAAADTGTDAGLAERIALFRALASETPCPTS